MEINIGTKKNPVLFKLKEFKGRKLIDIRKYFTNKDNQEVIPTKKGILLNVMQFNNLIEQININSNTISEYFTDDNSLINNTIEVSFDSLIGRNFNIEDHGGKTIIKLSKDYQNKLNESQQELFSNFILNTHLTLIEMFDDASEIEFFLDVLDKKISKML